MGEIVPWLKFDLRVTKWSLLFSKSEEKMFYAMLDGWPNIEPERESPSVKDSGHETLIYSLDWNPDKKVLTAESIKQWDKLLTREGGQKKVVYFC